MEKTSTKKIFEHVSGLGDLRQISVHLEVTLNDMSPSHSPPCSYFVTGAPSAHGAGPGCIANTWQSLLHSQHLTPALHSLAMCLLEPQHLKQIDRSLRYVFLSSRGFTLNPRHFNNGCGLL